MGCKIPGLWQQQKSSFWNTEQSWRAPSSSTTIHQWHPFGSHAGPQPFRSSWFLYDDDDDDDNGNNDDDKDDDDDQSNIRTWRSGKAFVNSSNVWVKTGEEYLVTWNLRLHSRLFKSNHGDIKRVYSLNLSMNCFLLQILKCINAQNRLNLP